MHRSSLSSLFPFFLIFFPFFLFFSFFLFLFFLPFLFFFFFFPFFLPLPTNLFDFLKREEASSYFTIHLVMCHLFHGPCVTWTHVLGGTLHTTWISWHVFFSHGAMWQPLVIPCGTTPCVTQHPIPIKM